MIKELGYDPNLNKYQNSLSDLNGIKKITIDTFTYEVPTYLILRKIPNKISSVLIKKSLLFTRSIIQNRFFLPNNLPFPKSRILLENYFI